MEKLYIIVRSDLSPGLQIAQSCHALRQFSEEWPDQDRAWHTTHKNLVCLQINSKEELAALAYEATRAGVACSVYREPDCGDEPTAIALGEGAKRLVRRLQLALAA